ncbi:hypothetical protein FNJ55_08155 [Lactococcus lactis]|nr:hypothetical protein FNJ55_08155 [Lactococcus lactis]
MRVINERWNELENELGLGLPLNTLSEVDIANKWRLRALNAERLLNNPSLTITKSIADLLDEIPNEAKEYVRVNDFGEYSVLDDFVELRELYESDEDEIFPKFMKLKDFVKDNLNLCVIYLAGKALGVDLVKVVEG